jgi:hypothetical protein
LVLEEERHHVFHYVVHSYEQVEVEQIVVVSAVKPLKITLALISNEHQMIDKCFESSMKLSSVQKFVRLNQHDEENFEKDGTKNP